MIMCNITLQLSSFLSLLECSVESASEITVLSSACFSVDSGSCGGLVLEKYKHYQQCL